MLIQQLKEKVFEVDLFKTIEENPPVVCDIKDLLKQLNNQDFPDSTINFVIEF